MTKTDLAALVAKCKEETKEALEAILAELNHGQRQKLIGNEKVRELLERYGVM